MRIVGTGLRMLGALVGIGALASEDDSSAMLALAAGGFLFVAGAVFAGSAGIQDAIKRRF